MATGTALQASQETEQIQTTRHQPGNGEHCPDTTTHKFPKQSVAQNTTRNPPTTTPQAPRNLRHKPTKTAQKFLHRYYKKTSVNCFSTSAKGRYLHTIVTERLMKKYKILQSIRARPHDTRSELKPLEMPLRLHGSLHGDFTAATPQTIARPLHMCK